MTGAKFGLKEWFKELNPMIQLPEKFTFYYNKRGNTIQVALLETKGRLENTRQSMIESSVFRFHPKGLTAVIAVKEAQSSQEYCEVIKNLKDVWRK